MSMRRLIAGAAGGLVIAFGAGHTSTLQAQATPVTQTGDQQLTNRVAAENIFHVHLGQAAEKNASNSSVKQFGQRMEADHGTMHKLWKEMASKNRLDFKATFTPDQLAQYEQLKKLSGAAFDQAYMGLMVQNHRNNLSALQSERSVAHSPDVLALINQDLATIQGHLTLAQQTASQVGADVSGGVVITQTDTSIVNPTIPTIPGRADTTTVITQNPLPDPGEGRRRNEDRQKDEARDRQGNVTDAEFIRDVNAMTFLEIQLGRLAQKKGRDPAVKRFGETMKEDHTALQKQWSDMASRNGMKFKPGMGPNHRAKLEAMEKVSDRAFDRAYMTLMIQNHHGYVNYWRTEGLTSDSPTMRQIVNRGLPTLEKQKEMANRIGNRVGVDAKTALASPRISAQR